ncbi:Methyltransferase ucsB [Fulvia fulva]|uniref:Methyltransferase ucsB n=1 Tax=Passalora fulva TaxID=5499 RepID=A0A9Q8PM35_PASFU|nr:Methyltransferase ucsB [Fulvia fulva]KAK4609353.1 Methyltransferase ucsB [Fulvia fulva]KAK4609571.1 Methyltransferase ucsB [Fulvia fulva]UJO24892.1 Methyltransferase ucsB [Fulvia fulva]WPV22931.1 Methyltransferase ucsB [Fulvia fulva]WPV37632.1 Methyltransferase ucsB [Fulvia fulva]
MASTTSTAGNDWSVHAQQYAKHITSFTGKGAAALVAFVNEYAPLSLSSKVLDEGAGTGIMTEMLVAQHPGITVTAADIAPGMLEILDQQKLPNVSTKVVDAAADHQAQGLVPKSYSHVLSSFLVQFVNPGQAAVNEMFRMLQPGGTLGIATWEVLSMGEPWLIACKNLDPNFTFSTPFKSFNNATSLENALQEAGCMDIHSTSADIWWEPDSVEHFVEVFMDSQNPAYVVMQEAFHGDREEARAEMTKVVRERYADLRFYLKAVCVVGKKG